MSAVQDAIIVAHKPPARTPLDHFYVLVRQDMRGMVKLALVSIVLTFVLRLNINKFR